LPRGEPRGYPVPQVVDGQRVESELGKRRQSVSGRPVSPTDQLVNGVGQPGAGLGPQHLFLHRQAVLGQVPQPGTHRREKAGQPARLVVVRVRERGGPCAGDAVHVPVGVVGAMHHQMLGEVRDPAAGQRLVGPPHPEYQAGPDPPAVGSPDHRHAVHIGAEQRHPPLL
jgi:hypothetical protein